MLITEFTIKKNWENVFSEREVKCETCFELFQWVAKKMIHAGLEATDFSTCTAVEFADYKDGMVIGARRRSKIRTNNGDIWETFCEWKYEEEDLKYVLTEES